MKKGELMTKELKEKIGNSKRGKKVPSWSSLHRDEMSQKLKGRIVTWGDKISKAKTGLKFTNEHRQHISEGQKGRIPWNKDKKGLQVSWSKGKKMSTETKNRMSKSFRKGYAEGKRNVWNKGIPFLAVSGENNHNWKGGVSLKNQQVRHSIEYKLWRKAVFIRDEHTCQKCRKIGGELNADHIKPFSLFPELRFAINNGRTLCVECHRKTDTFGCKLLHKEEINI